MQISIERLKSTLLELSSIGFNEADKGIYRTKLLRIRHGRPPPRPGSTRSRCSMCGARQSPCAPDHAGTAPMNMRSNAFIGLADFGT